MFTRTGGHIFDPPRHFPLFLAFQVTHNVRTQTKMSGLIKVVLEQPLYAVASLIGLVVSAFALSKSIVITHSGRILGRHSCAALGP